MASLRECFILFYFCILESFSLKFQDLYEGLVSELCNIVQILALYLASVGYLSFYSVFDLGVVRDLFGTTGCSCTVFLSHCSESALDSHGHGEELACDGHAEAGAVHDGFVDVLNFADTVQNLLDAVVHDAPGEAVDDEAGDFLLADDGLFAHCFIDFAGSVESLLRSVRSADLDEGKKI